MIKTTGGSMNLYVQLTDAEYEQFKKFKQNPNLESYDSASLASALLNAIKREGGEINTSDSRFDFDPNARKTTTVAKIYNSNFVISLIVEKY